MKFRKKRKSKEGHFVFFPKRVGIYFNSSQWVSHSFSFTSLFEFVSYYLLALMIFRWFFFFFFFWGENFLCEFLPKTCLLYWQGKLNIEMFC